MLMCFCVVVVVVVVICSDDNDLRICYWNVCFVFFILGFWCMFFEEICMILLYVVFDFFIGIDYDVFVSWFWLIFECIVVGIVECECCCELLYEVIGWLKLVGFGVIWLLVSVGGVGVLLL